MPPASPDDPALAALDRHALVTALWLPAGLTAATLLHYGLGPGGAVPILLAFAAVLLAFAGHVVVNAVTGIGFGPRELALGLVLYLAALLAFGLGLLFGPALPADRLWPMAGGFLFLFAVFVFTLIVSRGLGAAFAAFDAIRSFRAAPKRRSR